jgi:hypothetical protein
MSRSYLLKLAISLPLLVALILLDEIIALQQLPLLLITLGIALLVSEPLRVRLMVKGKAGVALLPFMGAALALLLAYCWRRDLSQAVLLFITIGLVFDILLVALAAIGEVTKRGLAGLLEFFALTALGLVVGAALTPVLVLLLPGRASGLGLAGP